MIVRFITKIILFLIPLFIFIGIYVFFDPYKIIYNYDDITTENDAYLGLNRDYVTHEKFKHNSTFYKYNSYIFGSSRTMAINTKLWEKYLPKKATAFSYNTNGESIYGIYAKIKYLYDNNYPIDNVLLLLDTDHTFKKTDLELLHYDYSKYSKLNFQIKMFHGYSKKAWIPYLLYKILGINRVGENFLTLNNDNITSPKGNDISNDRVMGLIKKDSVGYYKKMKNRGEFDLNKESILVENKINNEMENILEKIKNILDSKGTDYKIVVNPLYDKVKFRDMDYSILMKIFNKNNIYDFSGSNTITNNYHNYYERSHFKPFIGEYILKSIYRE